MAGRATGGSRKAKKPADPKPKKPRAKASQSSSKSKAKSSKNDGRSGRRDATAKALAVVELVPDPDKREGSGRPPEFRLEYCFLVKKLAMLKVGITDEEIADFFEKDVSTISRWKVEHPEFKEAIKDGGVIADMNVAHSLYDNATGYVFEQEMWTGSGENRRVITKKVRVPGDTRAQQIWLQVRDRNRWGEKKDVTLTFSHEKAMAAMSALEEAAGV